MTWPCIFHRWRLERVGPVLIPDAFFASVFGNCVAEYRCERCGKEKTQPMTRRP